MSTPLSHYIPTADATLLSEAQKELVEIFKASEKNVKEFYENVPTDQVPPFVICIIESLREAPFPVFLTVEGYDAVKMGAMHPKVTLKEKHSGAYAVLCVEIILKYSLGGD